MKGLLREFIECLYIIILGIPIAIYRMIAIILIILWGVVMWLTSSLVEFGKINKTDKLTEEELIVKFYQTNEKIFAQKFFDQVDQDMAVDDMIIRDAQGKSIGIKGRSGGIGDAGTKITNASGMTNRNNKQFLNKK
jgi:hypothetical protein